MGKKITTALVGLYIVCFMCFAAYYNWQYARDNGFVQWMLLGQVVPTAKAIVWPIFINLPVDKRGETAQHVISAIEFNNQAKFIINKDSRKYPAMTSAETARLFECFSKALAEAKQADIDLMNNHYPGFGSHFQLEFIKGIELILEGHQTKKQAVSVSGQVLLNKWSAWYEQNSESIQNAKS